MTKNLKVAVDPSYCYDGSDENCRRYGRLYTWESAQRACHALGDRWRLPTNDEWAQMAKPYGGVRDDSADGGNAAYVALIAGGPSGFDAVYGGGRDPSGEYARLEAHGFYWTATESSPTKAWFYNLGKNGQILNRHEGGEKQQAFARAVSERVSCGPTTSFRTGADSSRGRRPDQRGEFSIKGLPAGTYLIAAVDYAQDGQWYDPDFLADLRPRAQRLSLAEAEGQANRSDRAEIVQSTVHRSACMKRGHALTSH